jgi:hypothetical protein
MVATGYGSLSGGKESLIVRILWDAVYRFEQFVIEVYLPFCRREWKPGSNAA